MNIKSILLFSLLTFLALGQAQNVLSTQEAVSLALEHNYGIKIANNAVAIADNNTNVLNSGFLPSLTAIVAPPII